MLVDAVSLITVNSAYYHFTPYLANMNRKGTFPVDRWDFHSESILNDLPQEDIALLTAHSSDHVYKKGEVIFREGAYPAGLFYITAGKVKKYKVDKFGREQIIYVANAGELIGYHAILSEDRYPDSAAVLEQSFIAFISKEDFLETLQQSKVLGRKLLKTLSHEFEVLCNSLSLFAQKSVRERLALQLVLMREKYRNHENNQQAVEINMSRDDLASLVGTARENVVRSLADFKKEGIVETKGRKIIVKQVNRLIEIADLD